MKNCIFRTLLILAFAIFTLPILSQDYMNIYFKNGDHRKFYMKNITEIAASKVDKEGVQHNDYCSQRITTIYDTYVYNLEDVDSVTFKKCSEEEVEANIASCYNTVFPILDQCETIADVKEYIEEIKKSEAIDNAWSNGNSLYITVKDGETITFRFYDELDEEDDVDYYNSAFSSIFTRLRKAEINNEKLKVAIVNQTKDNKHPSFANGQKRFEKIEKYFKECGITPAIVNPSLDFFYSGIFQYDVVILCTHGNISTTDNNEVIKDKDGDPIHTLCTSEIVGSHIGLAPHDGDEIVDQWKQSRNSIILEKTYGDKINRNENVGLPVEWHQELRNGWLIWVAYIAITENFIKYVSEGKFPNNSLMFASVCQSNQYSPSLARKFHERNLGAYLGYDEVVHTSAATKAALSFFTSMLLGKSIEVSENEVPDSYKEDGHLFWTAHLKSYGNKSIFLFPPHTNQVEPSKAINDFNNDKYVEVEGLTTILDRDDSDVLNAISYGFEYKLKDEPLWKRVSSSDKMPLSNNIDKGNVLFRAKLMNLEPDTTYYYRAYTYDGMHYNYGEPCSFTTPKNSPKSYTTCPDNNHPHMIDLGLPSGTLWSCCNVGATKPEEYGKYYAWGETSEKSVYDWSTYAHCDGSEETCHDIGSDIGRTGYDAATANWGLLWRMPSQEQLNELTSNCKYENVTLNGVNGAKFSSNHNDGYIFLPAAGGRTGSSLIDANSLGYYWLSTVNTSKPNLANSLVIRGQPNISNDRCYGRSIRPVVAQ